jgi:hypothetical protein
MTTTTNPDTAVGTNRWYLSTAPIVRALVFLCVPMAAAMIVSALYNLINAGFIGSLHDTALLAAVTLGSPILGLVMGIGNVFGVGGGAMISRLLGAAEHEPAKAGDIKRVSSFAVWGSAIAGAVFGGAGLLLLHPLVAVLGANASAVPATSAFVGVMLAFVPVLAAAVCLEQLVRAEGAARQVMIGLIGSTVANLLFDVLFILVLHWGVAGAALGTGLANLGVVVYFAVWLQRHSEHMSLAPRWFTLSPTVLKRYWGPTPRPCPRRAPSSASCSPSFRCSRPWASPCASPRCRSSSSWASRSACCRCWRTRTARATVLGSPPRCGHPRSPSEASVSSRRCSPSSSASRSSRRSWPTRRCSPWASPSSRPSSWR